MREARQVKPPLQLQVAHPPDWLPEAHTSADLGAFIILRSSEPRERTPGLGKCLSHSQTTLTSIIFYLGHFGYHFPHPGQEEDILTEVNVKGGLHLPTPVAVCAFPRFQDCI
jgi:mediator of RNA polymerase II transcription subunit 12